MWVFFEIITSIAACLLYFQTLSVIMESTALFSSKHLPIYLFVVLLFIYGTWCNSMPFGAAWAYYCNVLVLSSAA